MKSRSIGGAAGAAAWEAAGAAAGAGGALFADANTGTGASMVGTFGAALTRGAAAARAFAQLARLGASVFAEGVAAGGVFAAGVVAAVEVLARATFAGVACGATAGGTDAVFAPDPDFAPGVELTAAGAADTAGRDGVIDPAAGRSRAAFAAATLPAATASDAVRAIGNLAVVCGACRSACAGLPAAGVSATGPGGAADGALGREAAFAGDRGAVKRSSTTGSSSTSS